MRGHGLLGDGNELAGGFPRERHELAPLGPRREGPELAADRAAGAAAARAHDASAGGIEERRTPLGTGAPAADAPIEPEGVAHVREEPDAEDGEMPSHGDWTREIDVEGVFQEAFGCAGYRDGGKRFLKINPPPQGGATNPEAIKVQGELQLKKEAQDAEIAAKSGMPRSRIKSVRRAGTQESRAELYKAQRGVR